MVNLERVMEELPARVLAFVLSDCLIPCWQYSESAQAGGASVGLVLAPLCGAWLFIPALVMVETACLPEFSCLVASLSRVDDGRKLSASAVDFIWPVFKVAPKQRCHSLKGIDLCG
ncbi:hypothetical protein [Erwinia sp. SLM-02]|uniref:hypothetical protein n=1 Tax=Erwinia sp. SLM-02 TaxID=3020057 RepID=UPI003080B3BB